MLASPPQNGARHLRWGRQGVMIAMATRLTLYVAISLVSLAPVVVTIVPKAKGLISLAMKLNYSIRYKKIREKNLHEWCFNGKTHR